MSERAPTQAPAYSGGYGWPWLFGALLALPTLLVRSPPMTDLPMHEGIVGLLLHWGDEAFVPRGLYMLNLGHANQLFHAVAYLLCKALGEDGGFRLAAALPQVVMLGGGGLFARHVRAPWWTALWLGPLALGWTYFWGLVPNLYGLALFLPIVILLDRLVDRPSRGRAVVVALGYAVLYSAHETAMAAAAAVHALFLVLRFAKNARTGRVAAMLPLVAPLVLFAADLAYLARTHTAAERAFAADVVFTSPLRRIAELPETVFGTYPWPVLLGASALYAGAVLTSRRASLREDAGVEAGERRWRARFLLAGAGLAAAYVVVPEQVYGFTMLHARFAAYAWALLLPAACADRAPAPRRDANRLAIAASAAALVALPLLAAPAFAESDRANRSLDRVLTHMATGQASMVQRIHPREAADLFTAVSCGRVLALRGGRCQFDFTRTSIAPVRIAEPLAWNRIEHRADPLGQTELRPAEDLRQYRYLILCCATPSERDAYSALLAPFAALRADEDGWLLYESTLPRIAVTAPEPR